MRHELARERLKRSKSSDADEGPARTVDFKRFFRAHEIESFAFSNSWHSGSPRQCDAPPTTGPGRLGSGYRYNAVMQYQCFAVGDEPYCLWEDNISERTKEFLKGLDPEFFTYLLNVHMAAEDERRASAGIRIALHHAVETLFSLLGALAQAPQCPYAWIARCRTEGLREVVRRIGEQDSTLVHPWKVSQLGWEVLAKCVFHRFEPGSGEQERAVKGFTKAWEGLSVVLLDEISNDEYNATKHGFRTTLGGFKLEISTQSPAGQPLGELDMIPLGGSDFGAMFFKVDRLKGAGGCHLQSRRVAVNWSPERDLLLLQLAQMSIQNIVSALRVANGTPAHECNFVRPTEDDAYTKPWEHGTGTLSMVLEHRIDPAQLPDMKKSDVMAKLRARQKT